MRCSRRSRATGDYGALAGVRSGRRGGVRGPHRQGRGHRQGAGRACADAIFASNTSTLPITSLAESRQGPGEVHRHPFLLAGRRMMLVEIILGKKTGDEALATALDFVRAIQQDADRRQRHARLLRQSLRARHYIREGHLMLVEGMPPAMIENAARMAGMPVGPLSLTDEVGDRPGLEDRARRPRPISAPRPSTRGRRRCSKRWSRSTAGSAARTARASTTIPRRRRRSCGRASPTCSRRSSTRDTIDVEELKQRLLVDAGAGSGAHDRGGRRHRRARGRCRLDPRLRLRAVLRRHAVLHRHDGHQEASSSCASGLQRNTARASRRQSCLLDMAGRRARVSMPLCPGKEGRHNGGHKSG